MGECKFTIFNRDFMISSVDETDHLVKLIASFKEKIENLQKLTKEEDPIKVLVYLGLNLLDEQVKLQSRQIEKKFEEKENDKQNESNDEFDAIINKINQVLEHD